MQRTRYSLQISSRLEFHRKFYEKMLKYKISRKFVQQESSCCMQKTGRMDGRTYGHDEADGRYSQFCKRA
jgi:hypothetical protein